ncbi:MAG TPA: glycosyltransferase family A protein [Aliidongia sp.]|uniref:glycosyltransferase family 2 protein n=1 Tax=Aliidongia sp. TaxID=1914230 RepID=UPI002DDCC89D|nr:glycosyltransferase family A protein [Aliidongia sp.]HEV2674597.1 glycosyltransferase family A protein [Aliidongia sp.]
MSNASITCVIPVRNGERFLAQAIESALGQTRPPSEIIVVDDGGTDRSAEVAEAFGTPVRVLRTPALGPASARNAGIAEAQGDLVALLDCDDIWVPGKLQMQAEALEALANTGICVCGVENFWMEEVEEERAQVAETRFSKVLPGYCASALVASKATFDRVGPFDSTRRHTDLIRWIMRAEAEGIGVHVLADAMVRRRRHNSNLSRVASQDARDEFLDLIRDKLRAAKPPSAGVK